MPVHNASVIENGLFTSVLLSCPWLALCFAPPRPISHQHSLHTFLSSHVSPSSPAAALHLSYQCFPISLAQIQRTVCLSLAHHFRSLSLLAPSLPVSPHCISSLYLLPVSLSFFRWLLSHSQVNVSNNVRLLCFCLLLKAVSFCLSISPFLSDIMVCPSAWGSIGFFLQSLSLWWSLDWHLYTCSLRKHRPSGQSDWKAIFRLSACTAFN